MQAEAGQHELDQFELGLEALLVGLGAPVEQVAGEEGLERVVLVWREEEHEAPATLRQRLQAAVRGNAHGRARLLGRSQHHVEQLLVRHVARERGVAALGLLQPLVAEPRRLGQLLRVLLLTVEQLGVGRRQLGDALERGRLDRLVDRVLDDVHEAVGEETLHVVGVVSEQEALAVVGGEEVCEALEGGEHVDGRLEHAALVERVREYVDDERGVVGVHVADALVGDVQEEGDNGGREEVTSHAVGLLVVVTCDEHLQQVAEMSALLEERVAVLGAHQP